VFTLVLHSAKEAPHPSHVDLAIRALEAAEPPPSGPVCENIVEDLFDLAECGAFEPNRSAFVHRLSRLLFKTFPYDDESFWVNKKLLSLLNNLGGGRVSSALEAELRASNLPWLTNDGY
jgi:hypothetical protein